jgi:glutathione-regulated potassium-efflux system ancillary protein KefG
MSVNRVRLVSMSPRVNTEDLIDAHEVARILGLAQFQSVSTYQHRYEDMPRPVVDLGSGRPKLWLRQDIQAWARRRTPRT